MTGNLPMAIINLFFVPTITMKILYKRSGKCCHFDGQFMMQYAIYCTFISMITKILVVVIRKFMTINIEVDSSYYTPVAILVAFVLPYIIEIVKKNIQVQCSITREVNEDTNEK